MDPEEQARLKIDQMFTDSGWTIQDYGDLNLGVGLGIAVREFPLGKDAADYALFIDRQPVGVVEAKKVGWTLRGVTEQSEKYSFWSSSSSVSSNVSSVSSFCSNFSF